MSDASILYVQWAEKIHFLIRVIAFSAAFLVLFKRFKSPDSNSRFFNIPLIGLAAVLIYLIGWTPVPWGSFADRHLYADRLVMVSEYGLSAADELKDKFFYYLTYPILYYGDYKDVFHFVALLYVGFYVYTCRKLVSQNALWMLVTIAVSFQFVSYGINTTRAGLAMAVMFAGMANYRHRWVMLTFFALSGAIHLSMGIPIAMFLLARFFNKTPLYLLLWLLAIPVSLQAGNTFNLLLAGMFEDDRVIYLVGGLDPQMTGFRADFVIYSLIPILFGAYFIYFKKFRSVFYKTLYNAYVLTNIFWVLVITANYTDRFASLSWCMMPFLLTYPILSKPDTVRWPNLWMSLIIIGNTAFLMLF